MTQQDAFRLFSHFVYHYKMCSIIYVHSIWPAQNWGSENWVPVGTSLSHPGTTYFILNTKKEPWEHLPLSHYTLCRKVSNLELGSPYLLPSSLYFLVLLFCSFNAFFFFILLSLRLTSSLSSSSSFSSSPSSHALSFHFFLPPSFSHCNSVFNPTLRLIHLL